MTKKIFLLLFFVLATFFLTTPINTYAEDCDPGKCNSDDAGCLENVQAACIKKIDELGKTKDTLANQIKILNSQYELTQLKITQTENSIKGLEQEINNLSVEIDKLNIQLNDLSQLFVYQTAQNYKNQRKAPLFFFLLNSKLNDFLQQNEYVSSVRQNNQENLIKMGTIKENYDIQKTAKTKKQQDMETLQKTLAAQKISLNSQKAAKDQLLAITKNDEKKYQKLLDDARSELAAISSILAGNGTETKVGSVSEGDRIASVISGASCSSSGTHLHFMVTKNGAVQNPFNYLKSIDHTNCSGSGCGDGGDPFNPSGNWNWPLSSRIIFNQGYGNTWAISNTWVRRVYSFHNGIDIAGSSDKVTTPISGTLYRGSYHIKSSNCNLRYVKVVGDNGLGTLNLHVNY